MRGILALLLAVCALGGCVGPAPKALREGGVEISDLSLTSERLAQGTQRIFEIRPVEDELLVVTSEGAVHFDGSGKALRSVSFAPDGVPRNPVASGSVDGQPLPAFVAHVFQEGDLIFYRADGAPYASVQQDFEYAQALLVGDLLGDEKNEVVVADAGTKEIQIYDGAGNLLRSPRFPYWVTSVDLFDLLGDEKEELIVYVYPNEEGGGTFYFLDGEGKSQREWDYAVTSDFDVVRLEGEPVLVILREKSYRVVDLAGRELAILKAPLLEHFAYVHSAPWRKGWVIVGSGSGYRAYHVISVFDAAGQLVYHEIGKGWSEAMAVPDEEGREFFVAKGGELWRYSLP